MQRFGGCGYCIEGLNNRRMSAAERQRAGRRKEREEEEREDVLCLVWSSRVDGDRQIARRVGKFGRGEITAQFGWTTPHMRILI